MKNSGTILGSLCNASHFKPLRQHSCYRKFLDLLPPRFRNAIAFVTLRNRRLMVGLSHPGYKMELNYNQDLLKSLLSTLREHRPECAFMEAETIVFFHSRYHKADEGNDSTVPRYRELATGNFRTETENETLRDSFERIRQWIVRNRRENS